MVWWWWWWGGWDGMRGRRSESDLERHCVRVGEVKDGEAEEPRGSERIIKGNERRGERSLRVRERGRCEGVGVEADPVLSKYTDRDLLVM